jgi:UPF0755 protein
MTDSDGDTDRPAPAERDAEPPRASGFVRRRGLRSPNDALQPERPPAPPPSKKRRAGVLSMVSGMLTFLLVGFFGAGFALVAAHHKLREPGPLPADKVLYIAPGTEVPEIIATLENEGVIDNSLLFNAALLAEGARSKLKAGEYLFKQQASLQDVMDTLVNGKQILHAVTIPEGLTSDQIVQRLRDIDILVGDIREPPKEGTLLPETYKVTRGMSRNDLVRKMQDDQRRLIEQIWTRRSTDLPIKTSYEMVTLASIVEKETGKADERPRVAGVFINRLNKRMRLQSDPTIVYGLVQGRGTLGRGILRSEVDKWTPYNTYAIDGLPPGPIANPGRAALEAVANPSRTSDLYFVADGTGGHVFASALDEHQRNVVRWRQIEKDARARAPDIDKAPPPPAPGPSVGPGAPAPAPTPARPNTRGDARDTFGTLAAAPAPEADYQATLAPAPPAAGRLADDVVSDTTPHTIAAIATLLNQPRTKQAASAQQAIATQASPATEPPSDTGKPVTTLSFGPDLDSLGLQVRGVRNDSSLLDGPVSESAPAGAADDGANMATYPVSAQRRAELRASATRAGISPVGDTLPAEQPADLAPVAPQRHAHAFDASEGTPLDPLRNKKWDLNNAQVIPPLTAH